LEYAINKVTGRMESAMEASGGRLYSCPVCKMRVSRRSGAKRTPHFAHWPGYGSPECENFVPGQHGLHTHGQAPNSALRQRMELRLLIPTGADRAGWSLELVIPSCRVCRATVLLDVGGRDQTLDMRGMQSRRRVTAEPSVKPYRIVSFSGKPDPSFLSGVERECPGLPSFGAAAFTASERGELKGFPRAQELRGSETFALLWSKPAEPEFPDELMVDQLQCRQGWSLALITIPNCPSPECTAWLRSFTGLSIAPPIPSIILVWPFLTRNSSVNAVECVRSSTSLLSAEMMPVGQQDQGPIMQAQSASGKLSAEGVEHSPAFFALKPGGMEQFRVSEAGNPDLEEFFSFSLRPERPRRHPEVELAFTTPEGVRHVVPLHQRRCAEVAAKARMQGMRLEYLSMPPGAKGSLRVDGPAGRSVTVLSPEGDASPRSRHLRLPLPDALTKLTSVLADPACYVEIDFRGFGRLYLAGSWTCASAGGNRTDLPPALRSRLLSFILQLRLAAPTAVHVDDVALVEALAASRPESPLIPHYRSLVKEVLACGFKLKRLREGVSP